MVTKKEKVSSKSKPAKKNAPDYRLVDLVVKGMQEKKAHAITIIDLKNIKTAVADYFVICSANTDTQLDAIRTSIEEEVWKVSGQEVWMKEGIQNKEWILLDYADVVAHIFRTDRREFYGLEDLWGDAEITVIDDDTAEAVKKTKPKKEVKPETPKAKKNKAKPAVTVARKTKTTGSTKAIAKKTVASAKGKKPAAKKAPVSQKTKATGTKVAIAKKTVAKKATAAKGASPKKKASK